MSNFIEKAYQIAKEQYAELGVNTDKVIKRIHSIPISFHCWQGDDVIGFEGTDIGLSGGIQATGNYLGRAHNKYELVSDLNKVFEAVPGTKKLNLHAMYLDTNKKVDRDEIEPEHFKFWVDWAKERDMGLDFNPSCFSHPLFDNGFTLSHPKREIRDFWIRHIQKARKVSEYFGRELGIQSIMNIWIPDGFKDTPMDLLGPRERLKEALDECLTEKLDKKYHIDAVESKLFGIGTESYVVGSHEFYWGYAMSKNIALCLDSGHFHPTEMISNKLSSASLFFNSILLHVSRAVRWDSDHVVSLTNELVAITQEVIRHNLEHKIHIGMDFFDASINRVVAWVVGARNVRKALLIAGLEPFQMLSEDERNFNLTKRLVWQEELKGYPWQAVWNYYCYIEGIKNNMDWFEDIKKYEREVQQLR